ncbi:MAG: hypothetical protein K6V97_03415 [Actinomycetia bacterium]|nr:hypothetical protein [Actinomycetes bacterium]
MVRDGRPGALCRSPEAAVAAALAWLVDWPAARGRRATRLGLGVTADGRGLDR